MSYIVTLVDPVNRDREDMVWNGDTLKEAHEALGEISKMRPSDVFALRMAPGRLKHMEQWHIKETKILRCASHDTLKQLRVGDYLMKQYLASVARKDSVVTLQHKRVKTRAL